MDESVSKRLSKQQRIVFIDFCLFFLGELKRQDIIDRFEVGSAVATRDIAHYKNDLGGKIALNPSTKIYEREDDFIPLFQYPVELALTTLSQGFGEFGRARIRSLVCSEMPSMLNFPRIEVVAPLSRAIYREVPAKIVYNSFSSGKSIREIVPFAFVNNGLRWHIRAYDRLKHRFSDFVLTRIEQAEDLLTSEVQSHERSEQDIQWCRQVELTLVPHPDRDHPEIIAMDYGMLHNKLTIKVRAALAGYFLRQWSVDCSSHHKLKGKEMRLWLSDPLVLYGVENAGLAPGYEEKRRR